MTDIVERLRSPDHGFDRNGSHSEDRYVCLCEHLGNEAAEEIEELRNEAEALRARVKELEARTSIRGQTLEVKNRSRVQPAPMPAACWR